MEFGEILQAHYEKYPFMQTEDMVKLAFQNEFGCGHMVNFPEDSLKSIENETAACQRRGNIGTQYAEDIGNGYCRILLNACENADPEMINNMFIMSASKTSGNPEAYCLKKETAKTFAYSILPDEQVSSFFRDYERTGNLSSCHHSRIYTDAYNPAYRVTDAVYGEYFDVFLAISEAIKSKHNAVISVDGPACSGKTYLAEAAALIFGCGIVHTDDFFLPPEKRTEERMAEAGGNFDRERFGEEVVTALKENKNGFYRVYSCKTGTFTGKKRIYTERPVIVEGSYSGHSDFGEWCDLKIYMETPEEERNARLEQRETPEKLEKFRNIWLPAEKKYFEKMNIKERCHVVAENRLKV